MNTSSNGGLLLPVCVCVCFAFHSLTLIFGPNAPAAACSGPGSCLRTFSYLSCFCFGLIISSLTGASTSGFACCKPRKHGSHTRCAFLPEARLSNTHRRLEQGPQTHLPQPRQSAINTNKTHTHTKQSALLAPLTGATCLHAHTQSSPLSVDFNCVFGLTVSSEGECEFLITVHTARCVLNLRWLLSRTSGTTGEWCRW